MVPGRRKKILFFAGGAYVFGAEIIVLDMVAALKARGHEVRCIVTGWNDGDMVRRLKALGIPYHEVKLGFLFVTRPLWTLDALVHYPRALAQLRSIRRAFQPDVIYHIGYRGLLADPFLFPRHKTLVHVMETQPLGPKTRLAYGAACRRASKFVAISKFIARDLLDKGVPDERIEVIYPSVDLDVQAQPGVAQIGIVGQPGIAQIGIVGQLTPRKGHADLLQALSLLRARGRAFRLHVFGRGPDEWSEHLRALCTRLGLDDHVTWHGFVGDRASIYGQVSIVVVPTKDQEAFGLVAAEPALWGLPVVAADCGGLPEIIEDGATGLLFPSGDVAALADRLEHLISDPALCARLGAAARARVRERFSVTACADALEALFERTCTSSGNHRSNFSP